MEVVRRRYNPHTKELERRRKLADVLLYRYVDNAQRRRAVDELAAEAQSLGLY